MDYLINKFSVVRNEMKMKETKKNDDLRSVKMVDNGGNMLPISEITRLIEIGFNLDQVAFTVKTFNCSSVEEALLIMTKDSSSGLYNHAYFQDQQYNRCMICFDSRQDLHLSVSSDAIQLDMDVSNNDNIKIFDEQGNNPNTLNVNSENNHGLLNNKLNFNNKNSQEGKNQERPKNQIKAQDICDKYNFNFDDPELCEICWATRANEVSSRQCHHVFCEECVRRYLTKKIENGQVLNIKCLYGGCPEIFTDRDVFKYCSEEIIQKYRRFKLDQLKLSNPNSLFVYCPIVNCNELVNIDNIEYTIISCNQEHFFCIKCRKEPHEGECEPYNQRLLEEIKENLKNKSSVKLCPLCEVIIEKNEGCNHMTCINCYYEFCWICSRKYESGHFSVFNFSGCPGMEFDESSTVSIPEEPGFSFGLCLWKIVCFFLAIILGCLVIAFFVFLGLPYEFVILYLNKKQFGDQGLFDEEHQTKSPNEADTVKHQTEYKNMQNYIISGNQQYQKYTDNKIYNNNLVESDGQLNQNYQPLVLDCGDYIILFLIICAGVFLQPLYLMFYIMWGVMWFIKEYGWWCFLFEYGF
mmetsp:Transcript_6789/g.7042  ORF Transcript_6789/g.7042 Transcript_6789/m.7042 type:complete len:579 (+) Transcript_6789:13-1749(+)